MPSAGTKRNKQSVEVQIDRFVQTAVEAIDSARSNMSEEQVKEADRKTSEMFSSGSRTKQ
jgi:hypothetical protein